MKKPLIRQATTEKDLNEVFSLRKEVFVEEQQLFNSSDVDKYDDLAIYLIAESPDGIIGTVRVYCEGKDHWVGSRLAVKKGYRGGIAGALLVREAVRLVKSKNGRRFTAKIQIQNVGFFKRLGWTCQGEVFHYMNIPHQLMVANLDNN